MGKLEGETAIVTGGAHGIGRHFAGALAREGATVAILDIADCDSAAADIDGSHGSACFGLTADVSEKPRSRRPSRPSWSGRDASISSSTTPPCSPRCPGRLRRHRCRLVDRVMAVNLRGSFLMAKHAAPAMIAARRGKIVNIASGTAYKGMPMMLHYVTSKGGVVAFTRALSRELGAHNICVNTLAPGLTLSDSILANADHIAFARDRVVASRAIQRDEYPQDLVGALIFLASSGSDFITGQTIAVDGGSINT
jgi:NAD(P)-dependent dehydrogenase (short-subunit alcohol dehydrogenase family)